MLKLPSLVQNQKFKMEIEALATRCKVSHLSPLYNLDLIFEDGLLRVGGRLHGSVMPEESKHPMILVKGQHISSLILKHAHQSLGHAGLSHTLSSVRRKFWITKGNSATREVIGECSFS